MRETLRFLWHMMTTKHGLRFDEATRTATCDCGLSFQPVGKPR